MEDVKVYSMQENKVKLKRVLGFNATYDASMVLVVSGTAMFSVTQVAGQTGFYVGFKGLTGLIPILLLISCLHQEYHILTVREQCLEHLEL